MGLHLNHYLEWTIEPDDEDADAFDVWVEYKFKPGLPAKLFGLPENCYPAEAPEIEFVSVKTGDAPQEIDLTQDRYDVIETYIINNPPEPDYY